MKILFVSSHLPYPLHSGGQVRIYNLLKRLGGHHEITLFSFLRTSKERASVSQLGFCKKIETVYRGHAWQAQYVLKSLLSSYPLLFSTYAIGEMKTKIREELSRERYDLVHIEPSYVWPSIPTIDIPLVVSEHNIEYSGYQGYVDRFSFVPLRPFLMLDVAKLKSWEERVWRRGSAVITVSEEDKKVVSRVIGPGATSVVANGVDLEEFPYKPKEESNSLRLLFVGDLSWLQNRDAVRYLVSDIWPLVKERYPSSKLSIVGRHAPSDLVFFIKENGATLFEGVEDIRGEYQKADLLVAPIRLGSGSRYKILEAMASGLPVITTVVGASGLGVTDERELLLAQTPQEFLDKITRLISDKKLRETVVKEARKRIEKSFSWETIAKELESVWVSVCRK